MTEVVRERRSVEDARTRSYIEWQTRVLASFLAANSMSEKGSQELQKAAQSLTMFSQEQDDTNQADSGDGISGTSPGEPASNIPSGSFEKLSRMFG